MVGLPVSAFVPLRRRCRRSRARRLCQHAGMRSTADAPNCRALRRRALCSAAVALLAAAAVHAAPPLPLRNLSVEMRISDDSSDSRRDATAGATVSIGSAGRVDAAGTATVRSSSQQQGLGAVQRVLVLNGGRASLRLAQGVTVDDTEVFWTPWGPGAAVRSQWVELVNGMEVAPRWPGGDAPVTLEIAAQSAGRAPQNSGQALPQQLSTFTTMQVPLGEWVEVAQLQSRQSSVSRSGFSAATSSRQRSLQVRVSLP
jgi:hypothetical protein